MASAAQFFLSAMIEEPKHGWLVTAPSSSPENGFYMPGTRNQVFVCMGPTMDAQIIRELFSNTLSAAKILGIENDITAQIEALPNCHQCKSSQWLFDGWLEDYEGTDPQHRHVRTCMGFIPQSVSPFTTPGG